MSATKILIGLLLLSLAVVMVGTMASGSPRTTMVQPLDGASATLRTSNISVDLNRLLNSNGYRVGYNMDLGTEPEPATYTTNGKTFVLARGRRCTTMVPFA